MHYISRDLERTSWVKFILPPSMKFCTGTQFLPCGHVLLPWVHLIYYIFLMLSIPLHITCWLIMCWCYHKRHFPPSFITWSFDIGKKVNYCFFLFPLGACGLFSQNVKKFPPYFECSILFAHNTHYWWIFSADTMSGCPRALYLHSQRNWQMVDDKRSIPWSCRRTASTDPRFQSLKDTEKQPNRSTAQHSARNMAGAWNICQDSLTQMGLVSKSEINPANAYGILLQRDLRATIQCKAASTTLALWLFNYKITDPSKVLLSRTQSRTACKGEEWDCTTSNEAVIQWEGDVLPIRSPLGMGLQDHSICHPRAFGARDIL